MKIAAMDSFEEKLIELVRECEMLYNKQSSGYKNTSVKARKWLEIGTKLGCTDEECTRRWKTLRDRFTKEAKKIDQPSGSAASSSLSWHLFDAMSFLKAHVTPRKTRTNYAAFNSTPTPPSVMESTQEANDPDEEIMSFMEESDVAGTLAEREVTPVTPVPATPSPSISVSTTGGLKRGIKRPIPEVDVAFLETLSTFKDFLQTKTDPQTELSATQKFGQVVVTALESLSPEDRKKAKHEIFQIVAKYAYKLD